MHWLDELSLYTSCVTAWQQSAQLQAMSRASHNPFVRQPKQEATLKYQYARTLANGAKCSTPLFRNTLQAPSGTPEGQGEQVRDNTR
jgi:hypothetical protein